MTSIAGRPSLQGKRKRSTPSEPTRLRLSLLSLSLLPGLSRPSHSPPRNGTHYILRNRGGRRRNAGTSGVQLRVTKRCLATAIIMARQGRRRKGCTCPAAVSSARAVRIANPLAARGKAFEDDVPGVLLSNFCHCRTVFSNFHQQNKAGQGVFGAPYTARPCTTSDTDTAPKPHN